MPSLARQKPLPADISQQIKQLGQDCGFQACAITTTALDQEHVHYQRWIERHYHGEMSYMARNIDKRLAPQKLVDHTLSVICLRMDYLPQPSEQSIALLDHPHKAYISRYALGRDYHKLIRKRLQQMANRLTDLIGDFGYRVFTDSAPVLEKALAARAGLGWRGKHSNLIDRERGSWFFLGEIFTDLPLPSDAPVEPHCGDCSACIDKCPTRAIVEPYVVDARRCISYLTIEHHSAIPLEFRRAIGNRIYGCDDCQLYCPWNRFEKMTGETDFHARHGLDDIGLLHCFEWSEQQFLSRFEGSPIRRIGFDKWRSNIAIALGNAAFNPHIISSLQQALDGASEVLNEHILWAIAQQKLKRETYE